MKMRSRDPPRPSAIVPPQRLFCSSRGPVLPRHRDRMHDLLQGLDGREVAVLPAQRPPTTAVGEIIVELLAPSQLFHIGSGGEVHPPVTALSGLLHQLFPVSYTHLRAHETDSY